MPAGDKSRKAQGSKTHLKQVQNPEALAPRRRALSKIPDEYGSVVDYLKHRKQIAETVAEKYIRKPKKSDRNTLRTFDRPTE